MGFLRNCISRFKIFLQFVGFLWQGGYWWLIPVVLAILIFGGLLVLTETSSLAPFIYAVFQMKELQFVFNKNDSDDCTVMFMKQDKISVSVKDFYEKNPFPGFDLNKYKSKEDLCHQASWYGKLVDSQIITLYQWNEYPRYLLFLS